MCVSVYVVIMIMPARGRWVGYSAPGAIFSNSVNSDPLGAALLCARVDEVHLFESKQVHVSNVFLFGTKNM